jgi:hypothetical protein
LRLRPSGRWDRLVNRFSIADCTAGNFPRVKFWLPTREYQTVEAYRRVGSRIPTNLCIRYSAHLVDGSPLDSIWAVGRGRTFWEKCDP